MVEGSAVVQARRAVFDPHNEPEEFAANRSVADELVLILTEHELLKQTGKRFAGIAQRRAIIEQEIAQRILHLRETYKFAAILLKDRVGGVPVYVGGEPIRIDTYAAESFFKIGSGDVFAAAFACAWAEKNHSVYTAAELAARSLAWFVEGARLPLPLDRELPSVKCSPLPRRVRIVGPNCLELGQLLVQTDDWLQDQSVDVAFDMVDPSTGEELPTLIVLGEEMHVCAQSIHASIR